MADPAWQAALRPYNGLFMGACSGDSVNIRSEPSVNAAVVGTTYRRHPLTIYDVVRGDPLEQQITGDDGEPVTVEDNRWFQIGEGRYITAIFVEPLVPTPPSQVFEGQWIDVNLETFYATGYDNDVPVYMAIITAGRDGRTPVGQFQVNRRVLNETMDSETVGIPEGDPEYYYLEDVHFTQYFLAGGYALHENYWSAPASYGRFSSNGCVGLFYSDAEWFWNFLDVGSFVHIHYGG
jgi:hypothetical protein